MKDEYTKLTLEILVLNDMFKSGAINKEIYDKMIKLLINNDGINSVLPEEQIENVAI